MADLNLAIARARHDGSTGFSIDPETLAMEDAPARYFVRASLSRRRPASICFFVHFGASITRLSLIT